MSNRGVYIPPTAEFPESQTGYRIRILEVAESAFLPPRVAHLSRFAFYIKLVWA